MMIDLNGEKFEIKRDFGTLSGTADDYYSIDVQVWVYAFDAGFQAYCRESGGTVCPYDDGICADEWWRGYHRARTATAQKTSSS